MTTHRFIRSAGAAVLLVATVTACASNPAATPADYAGIDAASNPCLDATPDQDADGLSDDCETALATAFAPLLMMHRTRCTLPSAHAEDRIPGGYFHAAQPVRGVVRLVYMPAYYRDCGWTGAKCAFVDCEGHAGDSEIIVVDVRRNPGGAWFTDAVFLSAHCFGRSDRGCRWYRDDDLNEFEWVDDIERGAPVVWVSDARNANYPSHRACERGHMRIDTCQRNSLPYRFPVVPARNIGSRAVPFVQAGQQAGCASGRFVEPADILVVSPASLECFWDESKRFLGWQGSIHEDGATPYGAYLQQLGL